MPIVGSASKLNRLLGISTVITASQQEINNSSIVLPKGSMIFDSDTKEFKIADGIHIPKLLANHEHPYQYAELSHTHMQGANEPWLVGNPRLWYTEDLVNHPELIALDGSEITDSRAEYLSTVYSGAQLATNKVTNLDNTSVQNSEMIVTNNMGNPVSLGLDTLFNDAITPGNMHYAFDKYITDTTDLNSEVIIKIQFKNDVTYRPTEYWLIPGNATNDDMFIKYPTPRDWSFEGSNNNETWTTVDQHSNVDADFWEILTIKTFTCDTSKLYSYFRLHITKWNPADNNTLLKCALRRFWVFGRKNGIFALPNIESPHPAFSWVVPYKNLNIGLHHEDVGDIGTTNISTSMLPIYRLPTDGRSIYQNYYPLLYASIGHSNDHCNYVSLVANGMNIQNSTFDASTGILSFSSSQPASNVENTVVEVTPSNGTLVLGKYTLKINGLAYPSAWKIEAYDVNAQTFKIIENLSNISTSSFVDGVYTSYIEHEHADIEASKYKITFLSWNTSGDINVQLTLFTHVKDQFYIPNINHSGVTTYIVSDVSAVDVTPDIIQRLQRNLISLTETLAVVQKQLNDLEDQVNGE